MFNQPRPVRPRSRRIGSNREGIQNWWVTPSLPTRKRGSPGTAGENAHPGSGMSGSGEIKPHPGLGVLSPSGGVVEFSV